MAWPARLRAGLVMAGAARLAPSTIGMRLVGAGLAGAIGAALFVALHPSCLHGPYADIDPRLNSVWLRRVGEGAFVQDLFAGEPILAVAGCLLPLGGLLAACVAIARGETGAGPLSH